MTIVKEVFDAIDAVSSMVSNIQSIAKAISDGKDFLKTNHPEVAKDLAAMCQEMRKSSLAMAAASSIITHFRFVIGDIDSSEAQRFNEHLMLHKTQAVTVSQQMDSMRGHCSIIKKHYENILENSNPSGFRSLAAFLGLHSKEAEEEIGRSLEEIYNEEMDYHAGLRRMEQAIQITLDSVQQALGPHGAILPENIPHAADLLGEYAQAFAQIESRCNFNSLNLQASIEELL